MLGIFRIWALISVLACLQTGCATPRPWLNPVSPEPLNSNSLNSDTQVHQHVVMHRHGKTVSLQVVLRVNAEQLTLIGLSDHGQRLFTLTSDGQQVRLSSREKTLQGVDPNLILTELQLVYWPLAQLQDALPKDLRLEQQGDIRTLWDDKKLLWFSVNESQNRWDGDVVIYNLKREYKLVIRSLMPSEPDS